MSDGPVSGAGETGAGKFVIVANRLPVDWERTPDGSGRWRRSPGGLVTALEPLLRERGGAWVGWPGTTDPRVGEAPITFDDGLTMQPVRLTGQEVADYYEGFSNATLWPLYHNLIVKPEFYRQWWNSYVEINRRFAQVASESAAPGATVWVQDYQLQLVPKMLRMLRPDLTIGFFLHIPFPPVELFMQLPWRREVVEGLLGADLIGFQRPQAAQNFLWLARELTGQETSRNSVGVRGRFGVVRSGFRSVRVGAFPISIASAEIDQQSKTRAVRTRALAIRDELGNPDRILLGVDRLDYTKGIDVRLNAIEELLEEKRMDPERTVFVQLATPSRERVESYQTLRAEIEREVGKINGEHGQVGRPVVHYLHRPVAREELLAFYVAADAMLVTPLADGMNLVAKEYIACRSDLGGSLVLSEFAGAAAELRQAYLVNPFHLDGVKDSIVAAMEQSSTEGRRRMRALRRQVLSHDVGRWARSFLEALAGQIDETAPLESEEEPA
ncbi:alpha,alpha-trehalose-phosphate synthase (UDP-forming) [Segniliparus rugosus]|uniref:alpha,alpha-trehalose-phosphate synthase (ADP-forming) n=1 Tax=Segniliparus rugosus (strain ATCC BAA-974 / DSM 45345 / CCUG 50838 / CIP 108380 / JCM 13579 / CDC 945) TaxID=679197 RepID=E5XUV0_SEGRC|nr:trehalose-6-phosphate synthase [Segniliparus rugosus]EFV11938.2 trehalose-phosphate synthase [Segniliparus rugosus ATCC BAA-974]